MGKPYSLPVTSSLFAVVVGHSCAYTSSRLKPLFLFTRLLLDCGTMLRI